jgi:hypothetical protein
MHTLTRFNLSPLSRRARVFGALASALLISISSSALLAQNPGADDAAKRRRTGTDDGRRGGSPEDMQARMLSSLRERFEITDDAEWKIVSERLAKVTELRRNTTGGAFGAAAAFAGRGPQGGGDSNRGGRGTRPGGSPDMVALQSAIRDKLPDAEIKSRLDRVRESRKDNEAKLSKAQEELRAVLSVRQEAVAVVFGLLP